MLDTKNFACMIACKWLCPESLCCLELLNQMFNQMMTKACNSVREHYKSIQIESISSYQSRIALQCALPCIGPVVAGFVATKPMLNSKPTWGNRGRWYCQSRLFGHGQPSNHSTNGCLAAVWLLRGWHWSSILSSACAQLTQLENNKISKGADVTAAFLDF